MPSEPLMSSGWTAPDPSPSAPFLIAAVATALCCLCALWAFGGVFRKAEAIKNKKSSCKCVCSCGGGGDFGPARANGEMAMCGKKRTATAERQVGGSMMEQLVPEITTHALSYLDYTSLCRLSMTNSAMRRAANDDGAWKALYHKDFTMEQDSITPVNGWKSYYAATKAIINVNAEFYNIIRERSLPAMSRFWLNADYVKCIHGSGELFMGYTAVINSWALAFNWAQGGGGQGAAFQIRNVRARVLSDMAWVTMKAYVDMDSGPFHVTNIYEFHNKWWYMVHHHSSVMLMDGDQGPHNLFG
ncbi:F-box protein SKIP8 [Cocos nucifera]|uniref:F-box protein SKIP8 n=1 Tax=Cocos nucifera TaxID=13894 RepID=A0A8K0IUG2_COCNU|nr:F-box protein SKIP8 [Cocos nucifera]